MYPYSEFFWSICGKIRTRKTPNPDSFYAVYSIWALTNVLKSFFKSGPPRYQKLLLFKPITVFAFLIFVDIFDLFSSLFDLLINSTSKKEIIIVGDSMIKHMNGREVCRDDSVKIRCHPGATTDNIIDYIRPTVRKKPDMIIIHTGTNDIQNKVNTFQKVRKVITTIKEIDVNNEIQIAFSIVIHLYDQDFGEEI